MNCIFNLSRVTTLGLPAPTYLTTIRWASKKTSSSCRNKKQAWGKFWAIKKQDGEVVRQRDIISTQQRPRNHPGLNVTMDEKLSLRACKAGTVRVTCERADMNYEHEWIKKFYPNSEGVPIFKKYFHVIPNPQHNRFKLVRQI